jgi:hypothetical protein
MRFPWDVQELVKVARALGIDTDEILKRNHMLPPERKWNAWNEALARDLRAAIGQRLAELRLVQVAKEVGLSDEQIKGAKSWDELARLVRQAYAKNQLPGLEKAIEDNLKQVKSIEMGHPGRDYAIEQGWDGTGSWIDYLQELANDGDKTAQKYLEKLHPLMRSLGVDQKDLGRRLGALGKELLPGVMNDPQARQNQLERLGKAYKQLQEAGRGIDILSSGHPYPRPEDIPRALRARFRRPSRQVPGEPEDIPAEDLPGLQEILRERNAAKMARDRARAAGNHEAANRAQNEMNKASAKLGVEGAKALVKQHFPDAELVYEGRRTSGSDTSDIDLIYKLKDGTYLVVEAKGGDSRNLRVRPRQIAPGVWAQQGNLDYLLYVLQLMDKDGHPGQQISKELQKALRTPGKVRYFKAETPIHQRDGKPILDVFRLQEFDLTPLE